MRRGRHCGQGVGSTSRGHLPKMLKTSREKAGCCPSAFHTSGTSSLGAAAAKHLMPSPTRHLLRCAGRVFYSAKNNNRACRSDESKSVRGERESRPVMGVRSSQSITNAYMAASGCADHFGSLVNQALTFILRRVPGPARTIVSDYHCPHQLRGVVRRLNQCGVDVPMTTRTFASPDVLYPQAQWPTQNLR